LWVYQCLHAVSMETETDRRVGIPTQLSLCKSPKINTWSGVLPFVLPIILVSTYCFNLFNHLFPTPLPLVSVSPSGAAPLLPWAWPPLGCPVISSGWLWRAPTTSVLGPPLGPNA
jgi:hypothetical protein